jgi:intracellular multiplication protein IcmO
MAKIRGVDTSKDANLSLGKDLTPWHIKLINFIKSEGFWTTLVILWGAGFVFYNIFEFVYLLAFLLAWNNYRSTEYLPYKKPQSSGEEEDHNEIHPGHGGADKPQGISFFGNEIGSKKEIWFTNSDVRTHCLIFGTTGAGKTESLLSICVNSLNQASGFLYIDGKGDNSLWAKVFSLVASRGRLDDLYLINYMTSSINLDKKSTERITNKMNPFATGNADSLTELIVSLLPDGGGDGMWKGRAAVFMGALLKALVFLRDDGKLLLDVDVVRKYFTLGEIIKLSRRTDIPKKYIDGIREYVRNLPGYIDPTPANPEPEQPESVAEQHGYITMQYTETFGLLADTYAHIMKTQVAEIDFYDIVVNRRILVVLLPALEKSKQSLSNLGRIIIASIKNMMSTTLGSKVEGIIDDVIETKPTNAPSPYLTIFDEYGYYATEGAAVMPAQARSLGFFMVFAGQDYQAFKKGSEEEAASIVANCAIKICMKLEDPTETLKIFQEAAGKEKVVEQSSFERNDNALMGGYDAAKSVSVNEKDIINTRDLRDQGAGEAHMLFKDTTRRVKMFYAAPQPLNETRVNTFLEIEPPTYENVKLMKTGFNQMNKKFGDILEDPKSYHKSIEAAMQHLSSSELKSVFKLLTVAKGIPSIPKTAFSIAGYIEKINIIDNKIVSDIRDNIDKFNNETVSEDSFADNEDFSPVTNPVKPKEKNKEIKKPKIVQKEPDNSFEDFGKVNKISVKEDVSTSVSDEDIDSIFDGSKEEGVGHTLRHVKNVLNEKYEELEYLDNQDDSFDSFAKFEELGLEIFTIQEQLNDAEIKLKSKLHDKVVQEGSSEPISDREISNLAVENNIIDLGLSTNKTAQKPKKDKKKVQEEVEDIISAYFD